MPFHLQPFADAAITDGVLNELIREHETRTTPRLRMLWSYFRNPMTVPTTGLPSTNAVRARNYRLAQERGLPARLGGGGGWSANPNADDRALARKEIVIENDIAWRVQAMVDFLFNKPIRFVSSAAEEGVRGRVEKALDAAWEASGGVSLLQDLALLAHVYGHADMRVSVEGDAGELADLGGAGDDDGVLLEAARRIRIELIEPTRGIAVLDPEDFRRLRGYVLRYTVAAGAATMPGSAATGDNRYASNWDDAKAKRPVITITEVISGTLRQVYHDDGRAMRLVSEEENRVAPGVLPIVHIQNVSQPFAYAGLGEVEPLIPLQDELNTRLSDRACRVTMQSFKMYLAKGIEGFDRVPVAPGQVWTTDNPDAKIESFGGDAASPSEEAHINEIREALDKASSVPPLAAGVAGAKIGNLTSENALRITLQGLLSRTARKRTTYGRGLAEVSRLVLAALDHAGVLRTREADRAVRVQWPDPLPRDPNEELDAAKKKREIGIAPERVLTELGYGTQDAGVV